MKQFLLTLLLVGVVQSQYKPMVTKTIPNDTCGYASTYSGDLTLPSTRKMFIELGQPVNDLIPVIEGEKVLAIMRLSTDKGGLNVIRVKHIPTGTWRYYFEKNLISIEKANRQTFNFDGM